MPAALEIGQKNDISRRNVAKVSQAAREAPAAADMSGAGAAEADLPTAGFRSDGEVRIRKESRG